AAVERAAVRVGDDLNGLAPLDRVGCDERSDALCQLCAQALGGGHDDLDDLGLRERFEIYRCAPRKNRGVDVVRLARRRSDQDEVGRCAFLEEALDVGGDLRIVFVVVGRFEGHAFVLEDLQQLRLQKRVHLADLVDEQNAAVRARHEPELRLGDPALREIAPAALIDRVVYAAQERVRRLARIPAQGRAAGLDERRVGVERREPAKLRRLEREPRDRRLADAGRSEEDDVLRKRRGDLGQQRGDRGLLADDLIQLRGTQQRERRGGEAARVERLQFVELALRRRRFRAAVFLERLEFEIFEIFLVARGHLLVDLALDAVLDVALRDQIGKSVFDLCQRLAVLHLGRKPLERRVFKDEPLQRKHSLRQRRAAHHLEGAELSGTQHGLVRAEDVGKQLVERGDVAPQLLVSAELAAKFGDVRVADHVCHLLPRYDVDRGLGNDVLPQAYRDQIGSQSFDRILELDLVTIELDVEIAGDRFGDLRVRDRSEELTVPPRLRGDVDRLALEQLRERLGCRSFLRLALRLCFLLLIERRERAFRRFRGELAREEEILRVALSDVYDVALAPKRL